MRQMGRWATVACLALFAAGCGGEPPASAAERAGCEADCGGGGQQQLPDGGWGSSAGSSGASAGGGASSGGSGASGGGGGAGSGGSGVTPDGSGLFVTLPDTGTVTVTLHPSSGVPSGNPALVAFGVPLPRGVAADVSELRVLDASGGELASHVEELVRWHSLASAPGPSSVRAALVYLKPTFSGGTPLEVRLEWGSSRSLELGPQPTARSTWIPVSGEYAASDAVEEPAVYATLPAEWLSACLLRTRATSAHADSGWSWFDDSMVGSARTAVNDVDPGVTELINYRTDAEPWLFDRALTLFGVYVRTGDVKWLRHAHRAAQFYARHIDSAGNFDLKGSDLKYSYGQSLLLDLMLTGDRDLVQPIERVAKTAATWNASYQPQSNFWTERHQTYALLGALSAFEATGKPEHGTRARAVAAASFQLAKSPVGGWSKDGCMLHEFQDHEGAGGSTPVCSPWMSALFADAAFRYYIHSEDPAALEFLVSLGKYVQDFGLYTDAFNGAQRVMPWYLSSSAVTFSDSGPYADIEHTCDVAGIVARAAWANQELGGDPAALRATAWSLIDSCEVNLKYWHRPDGPSAGKAVWRVSPARKVNWWFGTTLDLAWMMGATE
jgi:hypothetical protein